MARLRQAAVGHRQEREILERSVETARQLLRDRTSSVAAGLDTDINDENTRLRRLVHDTELDRCATLFTVKEDIFIGITCLYGRNTPISYIYV